MKKWYIKNTHFEGPDSFRILRYYLLPTIKYCLQCITSKHALPEQWGWKKLMDRNLEAISKTENKLRLKLVWDA